MTLLALREIALIRGGRLLFEGLSLSLAAGEAAVLTGPNGVGKSSLIRVAAGLLRASAGTVERGAAASLADENLALDLRQTLGAALGFWARIDRGDPAAALYARGIALLAEIPVRLLATGQRMRAVLARVIASGARLWLLDEPLNGLDGDGQARLLGAAAAHRRRGGAVLAASHQPLALAGAAEMRIG